MKKFVRIIVCAVLLAGTLFIASQFSNPSSAKAASHCEGGWISTSGSAGSPGTTPGGSYLILNCFDGTNNWAELVITTWGSPGGTISGMISLQNQGSDNDPNTIYTSGQLYCQGYNGTRCRMVGFYGAGISFRACFLVHSTSFPLTSWNTCTPWD